MTLRYKTLLGVGATLLVAIVLIYVVAQAAVMQSYLNLEQQTLLRNTQRVINFIADSTNSLERAAIDWAWWDDTYDFIVDPDDGYITSNMVIESFLTLEVNVMVFLDNDENIVLSKAVDLLRQTEVAVPPGLLAELTPGSPLLNPPEHEVVSGLLMLPEGPMLMVSLPILNSEESAPARGTLIWGRYWDAEEVQHWGEITRLSVSVQHFYDPQLPPDFQHARDLLAAQAPAVIQPMDDQIIHAYSSLNDIYGQPALILRVETPRSIYLQGQNTLFYLFIALLITGLAFGGLALLFLERAVLSRLDRLTTNVEQIGSTADLAARIPVTGHDELAGLAGKINGMLNRLQAAQESLRSSEAAERAQRLMAEALQKTATALTSTLEFDRLLDLILASVGEVVPHEAASIMLLEGGIAYTVRSTGYAERGLRDVVHENRLAVEDVHSLRKMRDSGAPLVIGSVASDVHWLQQLPGLNWARSYVGAPIQLEGEIIGFLGLVSDRPAAFVAEHGRRLQVFAAQAAVAIQDARLYEAERQERLLAQTLQRTIEAVSSSMSLQDTLALIVDQLGEVLPYNRALVLLADGDHIHISAGRGVGQVEKLRERRFAYSDFPLIAQIMNTGQPIVVGDARAEPAWLPLASQDSATRAWMGVPMIAREVTTGLLAISHDEPGIYDQQAVQAVATFGLHAAIAIENARILLELEASLADLQRTQTHLARVVRLSAAGEIAAGVAHQINNPLTSVIAEIYLLKKRIGQPTPDLDRAWEAATAAEEAATRSAEVVQRFLDFARSTPYEMTPLDINLSLYNAVSLVRSQIEPYVAHFEVHYQPGPLPVEGSEQHLEDVWLNLLLNARDAVKRVPDALIRCVTRFNQDEDTIEVMIEDTGTGIPQEQLSAIFDAFYTTKEYGTGLGLSICQDVAERHGGVIRVESEEGRGTRFTISLPRYGGDITALQEWSTVRITE